MWLRRLTIVSSTIILAVGCGNSSTSTAGTTGTPEATTTAATTGGPKPAAKPPVTKLGIRDTKVGTGPKAEAGDVLELQYEGKFADGTQFDANMDDSKPPFTLELGAGQVIPGWDQGLVGMQAGGERDLDIPFTLAYGPEGRPPSIPPSADLFFHVKLEHIVKPNDKGEVEKHDDKVGTGPAVKKGDTVTVKYTATYLNGYPYDASQDYSFQVGSGLVLPAKEGNVLPGLNSGVVGMQKGGVRTLILPPKASYGAVTMPGYSGNETFKFVVELVSIK